MSQISSHKLTRLPPTLKILLNIKITKADNKYELSSLEFILYINHGKGYCMYRKYKSHIKISMCTFTYYNYPCVQAGAVREIGNISKIMKSCHINEH